MVPCNKCFSHDCDQGAKCTTIALYYSKLLYGANRYDALHYLTYLHPEYVIPAHAILAEFPSVGEMLSFVRSHTGALRVRCRYHAVLNTINLNESARIGARFTCDVGSSSFAIDLLESLAHDVILC